jgi:chemotaxis methyl-accepting protein methylase
MAHVYSLPLKPAFTFEGLVGYEFGPLGQKDVNVYYLDVRHGHDTFIVSKTVGRVYYVLTGRGYFTINGDKYTVEPGNLIDVPPKVEYSYSGSMKLLCFSKPQWFRGNDRTTRWNPDVVSETMDVAERPVSLMMRLASSKVFGKSPVGAYLRLNQALWNRLPSSCVESRALYVYAGFLNRLTRLHKSRSQAFGTFFLRNRPELELIGRLLSQKSKGSAHRVAVLGCSCGPEAYSVAWKIRSVRPDLTLVLQAVDISAEAVEFARRGVYSSRSVEMTGTSMLDRMTAGEMGEMFDRTEGAVTVKPAMREGIHWHVGDIRDPALLETFEPQDMVLANNFLCHMPPSAAETCLRNLCQLVKPGGYLIISGIDLSVRTKVAKEMGWRPVADLMKDIHEGDPSLRAGWPFEYWGLEPFCERRSDWAIRYASVFQVGETAVSGDLVRAQQDESAGLQEQ